MAYRIFLVEDDPGIRDELTALLERYGYCCASPADFDDVAGQALDWGAQLVLLDLNLPRYDGYHVCRALRQRSDLPIMVVTSRDTEMDELMSMNLGADDFLTKPYNTQILLARMARLLQRAYPSGERPAMTCGPLALDLGRSVAAAWGAEQELTRNELRLLQTLMSRPGEIVSRNQLMIALWNDHAFVDDNTLTVNMTRLRRKLEGLGLSEALVTRRGQGYQLCL
ncbi:response regulator transcription factor [Pseudoflavonifractor phocaeensis]|uniref:response regulator transcription factor n=1 Tax=Pseudoflavonifractor phocaeensis TaxID=1870988 RepID=UPI001959D00B|nr:response regulator transcription factor [Pseudoflavonifractor phocaeensis]MBM6871281.1 response regulator transcription factor [Pseudoflavonifractor phocaeensis]MBM6938384.1 response regulator transcription factor [Pseudoflavonifractor phocaeensis]